MAKLSVRPSPPRRPRSTRPAEVPPLHSTHLVVLSLSVAAVGVILFYALAYGVRHFRVPVGDDTFFYVGAIRTAGRLGLVRSQIASRPAYPLMASAIRAVLAPNVWSTAVSLPFAMAAGMALAGGALAARWGARGWWLAGFVGLVGASVVTGRLVAGKSENLMTLWLVAAALAVCVWSDGPRGALGAGVLLFGAGLTESPFLAAFLIVAAVALIVDVAWRRWRPSTGSLRAEESLSLGWLLMAALGAAALVLLVVVVWDRTSLTATIQRLPPDFRYGPRLRNELELFWPIPVLVLFSLGWWVGHRLRAEAIEPIRRLLNVWMVLTLAVLAAGMAGLALPTYRALTFALPVAVGMAAAPFYPAVEAHDPQHPFRPGVWAAAAAALAVLAVMPAAAMWYSTLGVRTTPNELGEIAAAARYTADQPPGSKVVLVIDRADPVLAYYYDRVIYASVPAKLRSQLLIFLGRTQDALAGRPTFQGSDILDPISRALFIRVKDALDEGVPILTGLHLDQAGFSSAQAEGKPVVDGRLVILRGPDPEPDSTTKRFFAVPHWWTLSTQGVAMLGLLALCGAGWPTLAMPRAPVGARAAMAPAFGAVALSVAALVVERAGYPPADGPGVVTVGVAAAASGAGWLYGRRTQPRGRMSSPGNHTGRSIRLR